MGPAAHLRVLNSSPPETTSFPSFRLLPKELRISIWTHALQRERLIEIELDYSVKSAHEAYGGRWRATVKGCQVLSKLLRVCAESRQTTLTFHRVRIPCFYQWQGVSKAGILHICPEYDILQIKPGRCLDSFPDFIHDLQALDPRRIGLVNLALHHNDVRALRKVAVSDMVEPQRGIFMRTIAGLRSVYFVEIIAAGRMYLSFLTGIPQMRGKYKLYRSLPIMPESPNFERLNHDPRPISDDLSSMFVGTYDPREMIFGWQSHLQRWKIEPIREPDYQFLLSSLRPSKSICSLKEADEWLAEENDEWLEEMEKLVARGVDPGKLPAETSGDLLSVPKPAVGFWLFPVDALGSLPSAGQHSAQGGVWKKNQMLDLRHYWPQLGLAQLV